MRRQGLGLGRAGAQVSAWTAGPPRLVSGQEEVGLGPCPPWLCLSDPDTGELSPAG